MIYLILFYSVWMLYMTYLMLILPHPYMTSVYFKMSENSTNLSVFYDFMIEI